jgi:hypothetical protein
MRCLSERELQTLADGQAVDEFGQTAHVQACLTCRERWERLQKRRSRVLQALSLLDPVILPDVPEHLDVAKRASPRRSWRLKPAMILTAGLSLVAIIALAFFIRLNRSASSSDPLSFSSVIEIQGENRRLRVTLPVDLRQYRPITEPQLFIFKEENHELEKK